MIARLRAGLVVGGLWPGALCTTTAGDVVVVTRNSDGTVWVAGPGSIGLDDPSHCPPDQLALRLDDPLGLGLAGVAARVHARCRFPCTGRDIYSVRGQIHHAPWWPGGVRLTLDTIVWASTYLALTDRLCAAVGLELEDGEVARWEEMEHPFTHAGGQSPAWRLVIRGEPVLFVMPATDDFVGSAVVGLRVVPHDWQPALEACINEINAAGGAGGSTMKTSGPKIKAGSSLRGWRVVCAGCGADVGPGPDGIDAAIDDGWWVLDDGAIFCDADDCRREAVRRAQEVRP